MTTESELPTGNCQESGRTAPLLRARESWNLGADEFNQWRDLGYDEKIPLINGEPCHPGDIRVFTKSGNLVLILKPECRFQKTTAPSDWM
jgi:hypothetical protein